MSQTLLNSLGTIGTLSNVSRHSAEITSLIGDSQPAGITTTDETIEDPSTFDILAMSKDDIRLSRALSAAPTIDFYTYKVSFKLEKKWCFFVYYCQTLTCVHTSFSSPILIPLLDQFRCILIRSKCTFSITTESQFMSEEQRRILEKQLWAVANVLRGKMNADEYKNYILGFIFYKYLSEKLAKYIDEQLLPGEKFNFQDIDDNNTNGKKVLSAVKEACIDHLGYFLKPSELFSYLVKMGNGQIKGKDKFILEDLKNVLNTIEHTSMGTASEDDFKDLFQDIDLASSKLGKSENKKNEVIVEVLTLLSGIDFKLEDSKSDLLGDAYEYLIGEFAAGAGKKGGEFYTPAQVSRIIAQIVSFGKTRIKSVYDPTCGSGSLLLRLAEFTSVNTYFGQEKNPTTFNLARMNMILHGVHFDHFSIRNGDTLDDDMFQDLKADAVVANPPFSADWKSDSDPVLAHDERFAQYGRLAPKSYADYAFVTHMLHHLSDNGTMAMVLPHGALFRSGAEGEIRRYIIEKQNYLDAVIGLPPNLFYGTSIPATVLVFKKCRKDDDDILFIDASREFEKGKNQNRLSDENIQKIFDTYKDRKEIDKYSHKATLVEIVENDYNLNIPRYVDTFEPEPEVDIDAIAKEIHQLQIDEKDLQKTIARFCKELNIEKPF